MTPEESRAIGERLDKITAELSQLATKLKAEEGVGETPEWFAKLLREGTSKEDLADLYKWFRGLSGNELAALREKYPLPKKSLTKKKPPGGWPK